MIAPSHETAAADSNVDPLAKTDSRRNTSLFAGVRRS